MKNLTKNGKTYQAFEIADIRDRVNAKIKDLRDGKRETEARHLAEMFDLLADYLPRYACGLSYTTNGYLNGGHIAEIGVKGVCQYLEKGKIAETICVSLAKSRDTVFCGRYAEIKYITSGNRATVDQNGARVLAVYRGEIWVIDGATVGQKIDNAFMSQAVKTAPTIWEFYHEYEKRKPE